MGFNNIAQGRQPGFEDIDKIEPLRNNVAP